MSRHSPWVFFNKSTNIKSNNLELHSWKNAFSRYLTTYLIDESSSHFGLNNIDSRLFDILNSRTDNKENFLCSLHFGESLFPKESFNFLKNNGVKRFCVLMNDGLSDGICSEISLGLFDAVFIDSVSDFFSVKSTIQEINPFMNIFVYDNLRITMRLKENDDWYILSEIRNDEDVVLKNQIKQLKSIGLNCSINDLSCYEPCKPTKGWIVVPQMRDHVSIIRKSIVLHESGEKVFVPKEMFDVIKCCIPYESLKDIKNWSINNSNMINKKFDCSDSSDFVMKMLSIIHGS